MDSTKCDCVSSLFIVISSYLRGVVLLIGSLRNHDGYGDENVTSKYKFELFKVLHDYTILSILFNMSRVSYNWFGTDGF